MDEGEIFRLLMHGARIPAVGVPLVHERMVREDKTYKVQVPMRYEVARRRDGLPTIEVRDVPGSRLVEQIVSTNLGGLVISEPEPVVPILHCFDSRGDAAAKTGDQTWAVISRAAWLQTHAAVVLLDRETGQIIGGGRLADTNAARRAWAIWQARLHAEKAEGEEAVASGRGPAPRRRS